MYYYLYDSFLNDSKYQKILHRIENRTVDLGINGKIGRVSMLIDPERLLDEEIKKGATTIVAVGNDQTVDKIIKTAAKHNITIGIIPIGTNNKIAKTLGIPKEEEACDILSQRRVKKIDLIKINNTFCISNLLFEINKNTKIDCEGNYQLSFKGGKGMVVVYNLANKKSIQKKFDLNKDLKNFFNPDDGLLDLTIKKETGNIFTNIFKFAKQKKEKEITIIPLKKLSVSSKSKTEKTAVCDNGYEIKFPLKIEIAPKALNIIVGKKRNF